MGSIRNSDTMGTLFMDFRFQGKRCREYTALTDIPINRKKLEKVLAKIESEINAGTRLVPCLTTRRAWFC